MYANDSTLSNHSHNLTRQQVQSLLSTANALQSGVPFSSLDTGHTYHAETLGELLEDARFGMMVAVVWTANEEVEYRELVLRY